MKKNYLRNMSSMLVVSALLISGNSLVYALDESPHHNQDVIVNDSKHDMIKSFIEEAISQKPNIEIEKIDEYSDDFLSIYKLYRESYPNETEQSIIEKTTANVLNKIENTIAESEYTEGKYGYNSLNDEPDGYEVIVNYINDNLNPNYNATLDTTEMNIEILKKNMDKMPEEIKNSVILYIEDMEWDPNSIKNHSNESPQINMLSPQSERENASAAVSYAKRYWKNYNSDYPDWGTDCANFVSQCLYAGSKVMKNKDGDVDNSNNWFSYGNERDTSKVSNSWRGANMFKWHWMSRAYEYRDFDLNKSGEISKLYYYAQAGYPISFLNSEDKATHTLIITGFYSSSKTNEKDVGVRNHSGRFDDDKTGVRWLSGDKTKIRVYKSYNF